MEKSTVAVYPGTFDPMTKGHSDLVRRAAQVFDRVIVGVAAKSAKQPFFSLAERVNLASDALAEFADVQVTPFEGLLIDFVREQQAQVIIRGLRAVSDFEYEFQLAGMNRHLAPELETVFLTPSEEYAFVSSSLVRQVALLGGDVSAYVDSGVEAALKARMR